MSSVRYHTAMSSAGVKNYFSTADYYTDGTETVGFWHGKLCRDVGVEPGSPTTKDAFGDLCDNINPKTGKRLTLRTNEHRRVGTDFIFSLCKELSCIIEMCPDPVLREQMRAMVQKDVLAVVDVLEGDVETRVRKDGAETTRPGHGMIFAVHPHTTARGVGDEVGDPQDHWHVFGLNACKDMAEGGRIKAAELGRIYRSSGYYDALFKALVAYAFAELGVPIIRRENGEIGVAGLESLIAKYSKRTNHIEDVARQLNITDADEKDGLGARTRKKKDKSLSPEQLRAEWDSQLSPEEREKLERLWRIIGGGEAADAARPAVTAREAVEFAIDHCSEKLSVIPERELMKTALMHGLGSVTPDMIDREMHDPRHGLIFDVKDGERVVTTERLQDEERELADAAFRGMNAVAEVGLSKQLDRQLANGKALSDEQFGAVAGLLTSPNRINLVQGPAGAGKSSLLKKYDEGVKLAGGNVTYLATTAKAAEVLQKDGFADTRTVAAFLMSDKMQQAARGGRVIVDETSMLGHKEARQLLAIGKKNNLKFVFVGDPMQHGSVSRGAFMRLLTERGMLTPIRLTKILRQKDPAYKAAAQMFAEGRAVEGFDALNRMGWVLEIANPVERIRQIAGDYVDSLRDVHHWQDVLAIAPTHAEAGAITDEIRSQLRAAGRLGEERQFTRLVQVDTSEAERGQAYTYRPGDVLVFHQNASGFTKGDRVVVTDPARVPFSEARKFAVYREQKISVAVGDVIRFTGTVQTLGASPRQLKNGMAHAVAGFTEAGNIRLDSGDVISKDAAMFRHGFVETSIGSQGRTVRRVLLGMSASMGRAANMQQLYVSATRAWEWVRVYADDTDAAREAAKRDSRQMLALDLQPGGLSDGEKQRLRDLARRQRDAAVAEIDAARAKSWGKLWERTPEPPPPPPPVAPPPSHVGRWQARQQERGYGVGR